MLELIAAYGSHVLSGTMIVLVILGGFKWRFTWLWGLFSQLLWSIWIYASGEYGFLWMNAFMYVTYTYFHIRWERERRELLIAG